MPATRWSDYLSDHLFWAMDISAQKSLPIFTPLFGFSSISAPKIQVETETFKDGTYNYPRHVVKGATVSPITFTRAASLYDSDFYNWIYYAIEGTTVARANNLIGDTFAGPVRRDLLIIHFARINLDTGGVIGDLARVVEGALFSGLAGGETASGLGALGTAASVLGGSNIGFSTGPVQFAAWCPARCWILNGCLPISYAAGSDFNASSGQISLMSIEIQSEFISEYSLGLGV